MFKIPAALKAIGIASRIIRPTEQEITSINRKAYARLRALQRISFDTAHYDDGDIVFGKVARYSCDFDREDDWLRLAAIVQEHGPIDNADMAPPDVAPDRYHRDGWRVDYPRTCNVKYFCGMHPQARVIDLGAISA